MTKLKRESNVGVSEGFAGCARENGRAMPKGEMSTDEKGAREV